MTRNYGPRSHSGLQGRGRFIADRLHEAQARVRPLQTVRHAAVPTRGRHLPCLRAMRRGADRRSAFTDLRAGFADSMRLFRSAVVVAVLFGAVGAEGYNFLFWDGQSFRVVASEDAFRWGESEFPLRFRMLENDSLPAEVGITQESWTRIVKRSLQRWTDIPDQRCRADVGGTGHRSGSSGRERRRQHDRLHFG